MIYNKLQKDYKASPALLERMKRLGRGIIKPTSLIKKMNIEPSAPQANIQLLNAPMDIQEITDLKKG